MQAVGCTEMATVLDRIERGRLHEDGLWWNSGSSALRASRPSFLFFALIVACKFGLFGCRNRLIAC